MRNFSFQISKAEPENLPLRNLDMERWQVRPAVPASAGEEAYFAKVLYRRPSYKRTFGQRLH
jgi:hypothetical protein